MSVSWTKEQQQVINLRNRNILVSAAAGSGKTAVLVERIITRLTEEASPIDVDRLLIVTYTEAAAAEMKERIRDAIEKKLMSQPNDVHLQKQATLVHSAKITTIHSFCLSVIRDHFHAIDLDPSFRIAEEGELKLQKHDVLADLLEACYEEGSQNFLNFVECFATGRDDKKIEELILQLYEFSRSYPEPEEWLTRCVAAYDVEDAAAIEASSFMQMAYAHIYNSIQDGLQDIQLAIELCREPDGPHMYIPALQSDLQLLEHLRDAGGLGELYRYCKELKWERLASNRDKSISEELTGLVKNLRSSVKGVVEAVTGQYLYQEPEELIRDMQQSRKAIEVLTGLVIRFADAYAAQKASKNMIDFGDMEQFALRILTTREDGKRIASPVAKEYQTQFSEVMIDEYQDSNFIQEAILTSVSTVEQGIFNVFMVGDVKQSIYRFRLSRPELFMEKFHRYSLTDSDQQRIDLHKNFRSRGEVLDSTNFIFAQIMTKKLGGIDYDDKAALYVGADFEAHPGNEAEVLFVNIDVKAEEDLESEETSRELEARAVAGRIRELIREQSVVDKKTGAHRAVRYGDIVILTRSLKGWTDVFAAVLNREGIPTYTGSKAGYFETREVALLLDYLKILDNPKQDLPLAAVMVSMFGGFVKEELARIKQAYKENSFHDAVFRYAAEGDSEEIRSKLDVFLDQWQKFRKKVPYSAIHELLWQIIEVTGYGNYVAALPGGAQRKANVDMLVEKAMSFETTSYKGLFNFVRYIELLKKYDVDYGEANTANECDNAVRLMSIHKSKGLEFPIVFVAGMSKRFNTQDIKGSIVIHPELGIGIDAVDIERRTKAPTLLKKIIQQQVTLENLGEELRVLYVALTRAKEKLIMVGTISNFGKKLQHLSAIKRQQESALTFTTLAKANTYYDWVIPALARNKAFDEIWENYGMVVPLMNEIYKKDIPVIVREIHIEELITGEVLEELEDTITREMLASLDYHETFDAGLKETLDQQLSFHYAYDREQHFKMKFTVSELKKRAYLGEEAGEPLKEAEVVPLLPQFLLEQVESKGAFRGSAYHKLLELLDFSVAYSKADLARVVSRLQQEGGLTEEMASCISTEDMDTFLSSDTGRRMKNASRNSLLFKEQPFVLGVAAREIYAQESDEMVLVQGIIDVYFEEEGELVVLDYKTDKVTKIQELEQRYQSQLEYYAMALERLTGKKVKEKLIYSFALQEVLKL